MKKYFYLILGGLMLVGCFLFLHSKFTNQYGDPDRYYHFSISRMMVESGAFVPRSVPQVEGIGWRENFVDKEFLFHQLTALGFRIKGEEGVVAAALFCGVLSILVFLWFASTRVPLPAAFLLTLLTFTSPFLLTRLMLVRPHTLAIFTFLLMKIALLNRRPKLTAAATAFFVLSYHAFYLPLLCFAWLFFCASLLERKGDRSLWLRVCIFGVFGCFCGVLLNPYFPGNLVMGWIHARIPSLMRGELKHLSFGMELVPAQANDFLEIFGGPLLVMMAIGLFAGSELRMAREGKKSWPIELFYLIGMSTLFLLMSFQVIRAGEYLIPCVGLLFVLAVGRLAYWRWPVYTGLGLLLLTQIGFDFVFLEKAVVPVDNTRNDRTFSAVAALPKEASGAFVYNCEWDRTPILMYSRPDLRFIDILDPSLFYFYNREASRAREDLKAGLVADAYGLIRKAFKADYVLCEDIGIVNQLRFDPGFELLYPKDEGVSSILGKGPVLFSVKKEPPMHFVNTLSFRLARSVPRKELKALVPPAEGNPIRALEFPVSPFLNLESVFGEELKKQDSSNNGSYHCAMVRPESAQLVEYEGAKWMSLGGGQGFRVWRNGKPLFHTLIGFPRAQLTQVIVPLDPPLVAKDKMDILVCSEAKGLFWGVAISFLKNAEAQRMCGSKPIDEADGWPFQDVRQETCFGTLAVPYRSNIR